MTDDERLFAEHLSDKLMPRLRMIRADRLLAEVLHVIGKHMPPGPDDSTRDIARDLEEMFFRAGVEVITDTDRAEAGLPRRNGFGFTHVEMRIMEHRRLEVMMRPMTPRFIPSTVDDQKKARP